MSHFQKWPLLFRVQWQFWATWRRPLHLLGFWLRICWTLDCQHWRLLLVLTEPPLHICDCASYSYFQVTFVFWSHFVRSRCSAQTFWWLMVINVRKKIKCHPCTDLSKVTGNMMLKSVYWPIQNYLASNVVFSLKFLSARAFGQCNKPSAKCHACDQMS